MTSWFIVSWDNTGVEYCEDITAYHPDEWAKTHLLNTIKTNEVSHNPLSGLVNSLTLRARFNSQRHYEIFIFTADEGIDVDDIRTWYTTDPQGFADWVREFYMKKIYSDRVSGQKLVIV